MIEIIIQSILWKLYKMQTHQLLNQQQKRLTKLQQIQNQNIHTIQTQTPEADHHSEEIITHDHDHDHSHVPEVETDVSNVAVPDISSKIVIIQINMQQNTNIIIEDDEDTKIMLNHTTKITNVENNG